MILLVLLVAMSVSMYHMGSKRVMKEYRKSVSRLETMLQYEVDGDSGNFNELAELICADTTIQRAYQSGDRGRLLTAATPIFDQVCVPKSITHFYFHRPDKTCFLRVHKSDRFDDVVGRHTLKTAAETGQPASGLELGPLGTLTLRRVYPWRIDGELVGYLELGEDIRTISHRLSERLGIDIVARIDTIFLDRDAWQEGMKMIGQTHSEWGDCGRYAIADSTMESVPAEFREYICSADRQTRQTETPTRLIASPRTYLAGYLPLTDARGVVIGTWFIFDDVSASMAMISRSVVMSIIITAAAGMCIYIFLFIFFEHIELRLEETDRAQRIEIANRKFAEAQLIEAKGRADTALIDYRQAQEKLQLHIEQTPLGVIQFGPNLRIDSWNPAAERMFGFSAEEATGHSAIELIVPADVRVQAEDIWQKLITQTGGTYEHNTNVSKDGRRIMCQWHNTPLVDSNGRVIGASSIVQDITKELEHERSLKEAKEQAETANRAKSQFLANMTHELRTPMNAIIGFSDLLRTEVLTVEQLDYAETIHASGEHLLSLINSVLDASKIEAGKERIVTEVCSPHQILDQLEKLMRLGAESKGLCFELEIRDDVPEQIIADAKHLYQCLINLVGNAIKFTDAGSVTLRAGLLDTDTDPCLYFEVRDTGIGIPSDRLDKVFDSFEQVDATTSRKYGGTGLGLAISKKLIDMMGGALTVESTEGIGTSFTVTLPIECTSSVPV